MALKENYKDDILDVSVNTKRKYRMTENQDGTVSLEDETVYTQEGDSFGASDMNATNGKVNALETDIGEINDNLTAYDVDEQEYTTDKFRFAKSGNTFGMLDAEDNFMPFGVKRKVINKTISIGDVDATTKTIDITNDYPDYANIDISNIFVIFDDLSARFYASSAGGIGGIGHLTYTYSNGIITITSSSSNIPFKANSNTTLNIRIVIC